MQSGLTAAARCLLGDTVTLARAAWGAPAAPRACQNLVLETRVLGGLRGYGGESVCDFDLHFSGINGSENIVGLN